MALLILSGTSFLHAQEIRFTENVEVRGLKASVLQSLQRNHWSLAEWQKLLSVRTEQDVASNFDLPPMTGVYSIQSKKLIFKPQFPFRPGVAYRATWHPEALPGGSSTLALSITHRIEPPAARPTTTVSAIYPTPAELPENILKFYIQFSAPMSGGHIYDHIHLYNESDAEVQLPFLEIDEELWDPTMTRLTLFLDPGRIKRGVRPLEEIGPALVAGKSFTLKIGRDWKDAAGAPLKADFVKKFKVTGPDRTSPDPAHWTFKEPSPRSRAPLQVIFDEPIDHALAQRVLRVASPSGAPVRGVVSIAPGDSAWSFIPEDPWREGVYQLIIPTIIEDLAGNNLDKPFDVDLQQAPHAATNTIVRLSFKVR